MTVNDLLAIAPLIVLSSGAVVLMLQISFLRNQNASYLITFFTLVLGVCAIVPAGETGIGQVTPLLRTDLAGHCFAAVFMVAGAVSSVISAHYLRHRAGQNDEYFLLLLLSTLGAATLAYASHPAALLLGLELMGVALYALISYPERGTLPLEAAVKYLILSGAASATLLFGLALVYAATGSLAYDAMSDAAPSVLTIAGAAMIITGLGFKLSAVPFHMWTPDVYEGAPAPVTGFLAAVSKGAVFIALLRWYVDGALYQHPGLVLSIALVSAASIIAGNLLALRQANTKRLLAYSSIAHIGYLLIVLVACGSATNINLALEAGGFYLVAYIFTTLATFSLLGLISPRDEDTDNDQLEDLAGLFWRAPLLATLFTVALLSLAGIPLTAGFIGKFYLFSTGVDAELWWLLTMLVLGSAVGIYYYLRLVFTMTRRVPERPREMGLLTHSASAMAYLLIAAVLTMGILPAPLMSLLQAML